MEFVTDAGTVFETGHRGCSAMAHHRHALPFATIVLSGGYVEVNDTVPEFCRGGTILVHDAGEEHADHFSNDTRCLNVELPHPSSLRGSIAPDDVRLRGAVGSVVESFYGRRGGLAAAVKRLQSALLQRSLEPPLERPDWLRRVLDDFPWPESVPLREAAAIAGVHATHFSREFRRHMGVTANEHRARARVRLASTLLLTTSSSLARIALRVGLSDQSHLTRLFSERLGLSPGAYRRTFAR
ncbi:MAG TPA: helix-turn-helix domain-containing protein [Candidatus Cybelea sp.]|nr:helix-turn-helix domain-containing protein [Candidatus Cybelea sp.]